MDVLFKLCPQTAGREITMNKKIQLTLTGRQRDMSGEETVTETVVPAEYFQKGNSHYILYEENMEGTSAVTKNTVKLKGSVLELTRRGVVNTRMILEPGRIHRMDYATLYGDLQFNIDTSSLETHFGENLLEIRTEYTLSAADAPVSHCVITMTARNMPMS